MLELKNISYKVEDNEQDKDILDNVSYTFLDNKLVAITGQNGSGKSTLTKIIMGIVKPTSGRIYFNGVDITDFSITERARLGINYAFQQPVKFKGITVKDLIDIASGENNSVAKACEYLSNVGLCAKEYLDRDFDDTLSGGEQKRIELALSLAKEGKLYIFDEPEAGIDMWSFDSLKDILRNKSAILVSHQKQLLDVADEVVVLSNGKIVASGRPEEVLKDKIISCYKLLGGREDVR